MGQSLVADNRCRVDAVLIARALRHQAIGGKQDWCRNIVKLLLLALPCCSKITGQMRIFFKLRISMSGEHFAVCINIDSLVLCLFEQLGNILEIVTGYDNEGTFLNIGQNPGRFRRAKSFCVGAVQQLHAFEIDLSKFHDQIDPFLRCVLFVDLT